MKTVHGYNLSPSTILFIKRSSKAWKMSQSRVVEEIIGNFEKQYVQNKEKPTNEKR